MSILDAGNFDSYTWSNGQTNQTISAIGGVYGVTVSNSGGCLGTSSVTVTENAVPTPSIEGAETFCPNAASILDGGNYLSYFWSTGETTQMIAVGAGMYDVTVWDGNCFRESETDVVVESGELYVVEGSEQYLPYSEPTGSNQFYFIVCGGDLSFDYDYTSSGGFVSAASFLSPTTECQIFQMIYTHGSEWTITISSDAACKDMTYTNEDVQALFPQIIEWAVIPETCVAYKNGSIDLGVSGGNASCGALSYNWSGPSGFTATTEDVSGLASGTYSVTVTDCDGDLDAGDVYVSRLHTGGRGGRGSGVCSGAGKSDLTEVSNSLDLFPNPFQVETQIEFTLAETDFASLSIYQADGRILSHLLEGEKIEGGLPQSIIISTDN